MYVDYDNSLIGRVPCLGNEYFYVSEAAANNQKRALNCIRYAIEKVLEWDEDTAIKKFDSYIIREMKLEKIISNIDFPVEVEYGDPKYILSLLYPDKIKMDQQALIENTYENVLKGEGKQFPREYFIGGIGFIRFCFCMKYLIENVKTFASIEELYTFFGSPEGKKFLYEYRLKVPADQFLIDIYEVLHFLTKEDKDSDLYYYYFTFQKQMQV